MSPLQQELSTRRSRKICDTCPALSYAGLNKEALAQLESDGWVEDPNRMAIYKPCHNCRGYKTFEWIRNIDPAKFDAAIAAGNVVELEELRSLL